MAPMSGMLGPASTYHTTLPKAGDGNIGALIIGIGFWGPVYYSSNKEPPK